MLLESIIILCNTEVINMRTVVYPAVLDDAENGEKGYYTVEFPNVPGAIVWLMRCIMRNRH